MVVVVEAKRERGVRRGRQGGGHRVKMRENPPSGARTLIDFPNPFSLPGLPFPPPLLLLHPGVLASKVYTRPYSFSGCLLRPRGSISGLSRSSRDQILDDFLHRFRECHEKLYHPVFISRKGRGNFSQIEFRIFLFFFCFVFSPVIFMASSETNDNKSRMCYPII